MGWCAKGVGRGCEKKKNIFFRKRAPPTCFLLENVPPHTFSSLKTCPPTRFLVWKVPPHTFSLEKTYPPYVFYTWNVPPIRFLFRKRTPPARFLLTLFWFSDSAWFLDCCTCHDTITTSRFYTQNKSRFCTLLLKIMHPFLLCMILFTIMLWLEMFLPPANVRNSMRFSEKVIIIEEKVCVVNRRSHVVVCMEV